MIGAAKSQSLIVREQGACAHALSEFDVESVRWSMSLWGRPARLVVKNVRYCE